MTVIVGVSLKTYLGHAEAREWMRAVADRVRRAPAVSAGDVRVFVAPTFLQIAAAVETFAGTPVTVCAQDVSPHPAGAFTGEVTATELADAGVSLAEIGHAERRRLFGETDDVAAAKTAAALAAGLTPLLCVGEADPPVAPGEADAAIRAVRAQLHAALADAPAGPVVVAYEPVWAIGAPEPAPTAHIVAVAAALRTDLAAVPERAGSRVIYGGSAGPGLLARLGDAVDGVFLGRFAHDPDRFSLVLDEAATLAASGVSA